MPPLAGLLPALLLLCASAASAQVGTVRFASGPASPTYLTAPEGDFDRVFVIERGTQRPAPFRSIPGTGDAGLLCIAFPSDYASSGLFCVCFQQADSTARLVRYGCPPATRTRPTAAAS